MQPYIEAGLGGGSTERLSLIGEMLYSPLHLLGIVTEDVAHPRIGGEGFVIKLSFFSKGQEGRGTVIPRDDSIAFTRATIDDVVKVWGSLGSVEATCCRSTHWSSWLSVSQPAHSSGERSCPTILSEGLFGYFQSLRWGNRSRPSCAHPPCKQEGGEPQQA